jgi:tRNA (guanine-N7-)-methyltransferase
MSAAPSSTPRFYGRRKGRPLRPQAQTAWETGLGSLTFTPEEAFFSPEKVAEAWLEIGFGSGEHLLAQLKLHPTVRFLGCEAYQNGVASLVKELSPEDHARVRLFSNDVRTCLPSIPPATFSRAFVLFPDPWPKKRHHKRRLLQPAFLDQLTRVLKEHAEVRVASDDQAYVDHIQETFRQHPDFQEKIRVTAATPETYPEAWPRTRYGNKALAQGKSCTFMIFEKRKKQPAPGAAL